MKLPSSQTALVTRRLADLTQGGLSLHRSLDVIQSQSRHPAVRQHLQSLTSHLLNGLSFSEALQRQTGFLPPLCIGMIKAGESSGNLNETFEEMAQLLESENETRQRIRTALAYPLLLVCLSFAVCVFLTLFVIPQFEALFSDMGQELPLPTRILITLTAFFRRFGWIIIGAGSIGVWAFRTKLRWRIPMEKLFLQNLSLQRWTRAMGSLLKNGFTVPEALQLSQHAVDGSMLRNQIFTIHQRIVEGKNLSSALAASSFFPSLISELVGAGEESGRLDDIFLRLAHTYRRESERQIKLALSLLEPTLILLMGLVVGFVAVAMLLPIFEMSGRMR